MGLKDVFVSCYDRRYNSLSAFKRIQDNSLGLGASIFNNTVKGKWTLITGAARGVGRQIAVEMAKLGSNIIAHSRSASHVAGLVDVCSDFGVKVVPVAAELGNPSEVEAMLSELSCLAPQIDIVFNNAAVSPPCPSGFWSMPSGDFVTSYAVNTIAPVLICREIIPQMIQRGFGRVINITSSIQKRPGEMAYACSKAALDKFVFDLAPSLEGTGVMITLADPGWLRTDMGGDIAAHPVESVIPGVLLGALLDGDINGRWFSVQDYAGLSIEDAVLKAKIYYSQG
ncbi:MAG: SDR family oxidoreductase [Nitrospirae bacterium]|nr:SDR family oxidoreductase [Nitrospirota bacterium]